MADFASESRVHSDALGSRHMSSSFFNIPGYFVGFGLRGSSDSESIKSPTSPLDFSFFSNLSSQFSLKHPKSPTQNGHQNKWNSSKVGLGIVNLLVDETKSTNVVLSSPKRKNIIFGSEVKAGYSMRSKSFPADYMFMLLSKTEAPKAGVCLETESLQNSSSISLSQKSPFSSKKFCSENRTTTVSSSSLFSDGGRDIDSSLDIKSSSLPIPIGSLSAREIELSEDYTCIISYGPNPKTTHIFGDCVLECHTNELPNVNELSQEADCLDSSASFLSFCYSCKKKLEEGDDIFIYRYLLA